ncbi:MAG: hypothetical protein IKD61_03785 [Oscillospiraceae bacterium]|nr:hypothetical protein [Oscillospiraceae bacterium]
MLRFLKGSKLLFGVSMFSAALAALADMLSPQIIRAAIDNAIGGKEAEFPAWVMRRVDALGGFSYLGEHLWIMALAVVAVAAIKVASQYIFRVSNTKASETLVKTMRDTAFSHIEHLPFSWHMKNRTGDIIQRCTSDIDTMKNFVSEQLTNVFRIFVMLVLSLMFMLSMDVPLTLIAFIPMPVIILYSLYFIRSSARALWTATKTRVSSRRWRRRTSRACASCAPSAASALKKTSLRRRTPTIPDCGKSSARS